MISWIACEDFGPGIHSTKCSYAESLILDKLSLYISCTIFRRTLCNREKISYNNSKKELFLSLLYDSI